MIFYHCTNKENFESIMKFGLCPERFAKMGFMGKTLYFSTEPNNGFGDLCFEVDLTGIDFHSLSDWEIVTLCGSIPPERLKVYERRKHENS